MTAEIVESDGSRGVTGSLPRSISPALLQVHGRRPFPDTPAEIAEIAAAVRDPSFRVQVSEAGIHVYNRDGMRMSGDPFELWPQLGELGLLGVKAFMFQEGHDPVAEQAFREIARLTRGAYCRFDPGAAHELAALLRAAAAYAAGGMSALADLSARRDPGAIKLIQQMR